MSDFTGKVALVTGAGSGIGAKVARRLLDYGAIVFVADIDAMSAQTVADHAPDRAFPVQLNVCDANATGRMIDDIVAEYGALHLAVNNAGIGADTNLIHEEPPEAWRKTLSVNLDGTYNCLHHELRVMLSSGGSIVNMASVLGHKTFHRAAAYVASKHAVIGLTKAAANDYAVHGIRINAVCPGFIDTPPLRARMDDEQQLQVAALHPMGRLGTTDEVAALTAFLLSDEAAFITGGSYIVDGGYSVRP
jgi:NAD(P)-dependent dehydrogenase (short-subunit alcohol dehydrogenase family)